MRYASENKKQARALHFREASQPDRQGTNVVDPTAKFEVDTATWKQTYGEWDQGGADHWRRHKRTNDRTRPAQCLWKQPSAAEAWEKCFVIKRDVLEVNRAGNRLNDDSLDSWCR